MRIVNTLSGICVLATSLSFARIVEGNLRHHLEFVQHLDVTHASHAAAHTPAFVVSFGGGVIIVLLSAIGGVLLVTRR